MRNLLTEADARAVFEAALAEAESLTALAQRCKVSPSLVWDVKNGNRRLTGDLARGLGLEPVLMFERVESATGTRRS